MEEKKKYYIYTYDYVVFDGVFISRRNSTL